jgi:hypothetical protein
MTEKEQEAELPVLFVATQLIVVKPSGKRLPEGGEHWTGRFVVHRERAVA